MVRAVVSDDRRPGIAGIGGIDNQDGQALVLRRIGVGTAGQPHVVGVMTAGREELLAVDHVLVAVQYRPRGQGRQVGARARLGVADGEMQLPGEDLGQEEVFLFLTTVCHQGRAHGLQRDRRQRHVGQRGFVDEDLLLELAEAAPAILEWPADAEPAVAAHSPDDLAVDMAVTLGEHRLALGR